jgi:CheY-like chemotaxis protein
MAMTDPASPKPDPAALARLRREFIVDARSSIADARKAAKRHAASADADLLERLRRWSRNLKDSGSSYGFPGLSEIGTDIARQLESPKPFPEKAILDALDLMSKELSSVRSPKPSCSLPGKEERRLPAPPARTRQRRLLMIDDDPILRKIAKTALEQSREYAVRTLADGDKAVDTAATQEADLIILDAAMPGEDGYTVCRRLKADPRTKNIPVVFLSANDREQDRSRALEAGAASFIAKPFKPVALSGEIRRLLSTARAADSA